MEAWKEGWREVEARNRAKRCLDCVAHLVDKNSGKLYSSAKFKIKYQFYFALEYNLPLFLRNRASKEEGREGSNKEGRREVEAVKEERKQARKQRGKKEGRREGGRWR